MAAIHAPVPSAMAIYPSWLTVEYATTRLMSYCVTAMVAAMNAVSAPTIATTSIAVGEATKIGWARATMKMPAVTIVAAWIRAETGVGPSIASGNQTKSGTCADFPTAPVKRSSAMAVTVPALSVPTRSKTSA